MTLLIHPPYRSPLCDRSLLLMQSCTTFLPMKEMAREKGPHTREPWKSQVTRAHEWKMEPTWEQRTPKRPR